MDVCTCMCRRNERVYEGNWTVPGLMWAPHSLLDSLLASGVLVFAFSFSGVSAS